MHSRIDSKSCSIKELDDPTLLELLSFLSPEDIQSATTLNKQFYELAHDNLLWHKKFELHFPHVFSQLDNTTNRSWHNEFHTTYKTEYAHLSEKERKLFSLVKENDVDSLKKILTFSDLKGMTITNHALIYWASKKGYQAILDLFYQVAAMNYHIKDVDDNSSILFLITQLLLHQATAIDLLIWATACNQSAKTINPLLSVDFRRDASINGTTLLHIAAYYGHIDVVNILLSFKVNAFLPYNVHDVLSDTGETPLCIAAQEDHVEIVNALLANGAKINAGYCYSDGTVTPLYIAAREGHVEIVKTLLAKGAKINAGCHLEDGIIATPLYIAVQEDYVEIVNVLLANGAKINAGYCSSDGATETPLFIAAREGHVEVVNALLAKGAKINAGYHLEDGIIATPLFIAAQEGHVETVKALLAKGANINAGCRSSDGSTATPLYIAAQEGHVETVKALLAKGANINAGYHLEDGTVTPLFIAAKRGHAKIVNALLIEGANINTRSINGETPLDIAVEMHHIEIIKALNKQKLINYIKNRESENSPMYQTSYKFFGHTFNFGFPKDQEIAGAKALLKVSNGKAKETILKKNEKVLESSELKPIYRSLIKRK